MEQKLDPIVDNTQQVSHDTDNEKLRGLFGYPDSKFTRTSNKYLDEFENMFLKPSMTMFDDNG